MAYADVSLASTSVTNPVFGAGTTFNFGSTIWGATGNNDQSARTDAAATAALGNAASSIAPSGSGSPEAQQSFFASVPTPVWYIGGGAILLVAAFFMFRR